jgi:ribosomal protein S18 acetylase RimI-like enzyme
MLCTAPGRSRLGAGSALLRWGAELADRERLPIWLEATATGYPLYRRFGFEVVDTLDLNVSERWGATRRADEDWGANAGVALFGTAPEGVVRTVGMRRPPGASS